MCIGANEAFIWSQQEWVEYLTQHPGKTYEAIPTGPFYVFSRIVSAEGKPAEWMHHFFTQDKAAKLLQREACKAVVFVDRNILGVSLDTLRCHADNRGYLVELFRKDELQERGRRADRIEYPPMAYFTKTLAGQMRGPHEHATQTDVMIFCESAFEIFLWDMRENSHTRYCRMRLITDRVLFQRLIIPPGVVHTYQAVGQDGIIVNCPDKLYRGWQRRQPVDEIRHEDNPENPFKPW